MAMAAAALHHRLPCRPIHSSRISGKTQKGRLQFIAFSSSPSPPSEAAAQTAESCVNLGLSLFSKGRVKDALMQFESALALDPNPIETQAALYNKACCHAYRGEGKIAAECLRTALRDYNLKFSTILDDPDLASFRALPEFKELQEEARLGGEDIGYGFRRDLKLISEVQAPFRGVRRFFYVAFSAAAGISTFFTVPRLIRAISGGENAPDLWETAGNAAINIGGFTVLVALFFWENKKEEEQLAQITRDETLSRLPLRLSTSRIVELVQLRETTRPVILAGKKETVSRAIEKAERFRTDLVKRGILLIPVIWGDYKQTPIEKKGFGLPLKAAASLPSIGPMGACLQWSERLLVPDVAAHILEAIVSNPGIASMGWNHVGNKKIQDDFEKRAQSITAKSRLKAEVRLKAEIVSPNEWQRWILDQQKSEGVNPGDDVYIILRLDGRVRRSGKGMPDWQQILKELPPLEDFLSKLER